MELGHIFENVRLLAAFSMVGAGKERNAKLHRRSSLKNIHLMQRWMSSRVRLFVRQREFVESDVANERQHEDVGLALRVVCGVHKEREEIHLFGRRCEARGCLRAGWSVRKECEWTRPSFVGAMIDTRLGKMMRPASCKCIAPVWMTQW